MILEPLAARTVGGSAVRGVLLSELTVWHAPDNFGDLLGPAILQRLGYRVRPVEDVADAELIACGSTIEMVLPQARDGLMVWGSGLLHGEAVDVSRLDIRAVRGRLTAALTEVSVPAADPAVLVPELWVKPPVKYRVGVVRHYVDEDPYPWADAVISTRASVEEVLSFIGSCARVVSSSLHGAIVAQAWGIPYMRVHHPGVWGGNFKWIDYLSGDSSPEDLVKSLP